MGFREVFDAYLDVGYKFDRYGYGGGRFVSPAGTSYRGRALRPGSDKLPYNTYEVIFPLQVKYGPARAWFGYEGGVAQMLLPDSIDNLLARGWIRKN
jgi:filamentous hemagglutinin